MSDQTIDPARAWKDHRRECEHCDLSNPGCDVGDVLYARHREQRPPPPTEKAERSRGEVAGGILVIVVFGAVLIGVGFAVSAFLGGDDAEPERPTRSVAPRVLTATPGPNVRFRTFYAMDPLPGVHYSDVESMALSACEAFDDGTSAADLILVILDRMSPEYHERTAELLGAGVAAFCPEYSRRFRELAQ